MDTKFFYQALRNWQQRNQTFQTYDRLTPAQQSEIARDAQNLKKNNPLNLSPEGLRNHEACLRILRRRSS